MTGSILLPFRSPPLLAWGLDRAGSWNIIVSFPFGIGWENVNRQDGCVYNMLERG